MKMELKIKYISKRNTTRIVIDRCGETEGLEKDFNSLYNPEELGK